ncbi:MAG: protease inhibitor Inh/omp19 family protein [Rhizobiaceae bacterium]
MGTLRAGLRGAAPLALLALLAVGMTACQGTRIPYLNTRNKAPEPLTPAPTGTVETEELKPAEGTTEAGDFPDAPDEKPVNVEVASANAPDITKNGVVGSWKTAAGGVNCQMFLTLTKYGDNSRGGTRGCAGELQGMRGWNVAGKQLVLFDENGARIAILYSTGSERFDGQTTGGQAVSLSR